METKERLYQAIKAIDNEDWQLAVDILREVREEIIEIILETEKAETMRSYDLEVYNKNR